MKPHVHAAAALLVAAQAAVAGDLELAGAWLREPPPGRAMLAIYLEARNAGARPLTVAGVRVDGAASAGLHESVQENGMVRMRDVGAITIAPGETLRFVPGGLHVMVYGRAAAPRVGEQVGVCLVLDDRSEHCTQARVKALGEG